jgi:hypothetical protein
MAGPRALEPMELSPDLYSYRVTAFADFDKIPLSAI